MAHHFFPRSLYNNAHTEQGFTPLFRLLDDFDRYSSTSSGRGGSGRAAVPSFQPKFDVRETEGAYELHGELAGITRDNVHIEFTDPQTMLVRGRVERTYTSGTPPAGRIEGVGQRAAVTDGSEQQQQQQQQQQQSGEGEHRAHSPHRVTVQDETEAEAEEAGTEMTPASTVAEPDQSSRKPRDTAKYWISERSIGEFSRSFSFPTRVEQDGVKASLNDGVLTVVVPKAKKHEARRIAIS